MTKFEKVSKRAELLGQAYQTIIDKAKWVNYDPWSGEPALIDDRTEEQEFYMSIAKEIENLL